MTPNFSADEVSRAVRSHTVGYVISWGALAGFAAAMGWLLWNEWTSGDPSHVYWLLPLEAALVIGCALYLVFRMRSTRRFRSVLHSSLENPVLPRVVSGRLCDIQQTAFWTFYVVMTSEDDDAEMYDVRTARRRCASTVGNPVQLTLYAHGHGHLPAESAASLVNLSTGERDPATVRGPF